MLVTLGKYLSPFILSPTKFEGFFDGYKESKPMRRARPKRKSTKIRTTNKFRAEINLSEK